MKACQTYDPTSMEVTEVDIVTSTAESPSSFNQRDATKITDRVAASSACMSCRDKHLKCDGLPVCTRCATQGATCIYFKSRRGYRGRGVYGKQVSSTNGKLTLTKKLT